MTNKYIDAEKLKETINKRLQENADKACLFGSAFAGRAAEDNDIINIVTSLQQERTELPGYNKALLEVKSKVDELYEETSIGLSEYDSGLYNGIAETCMKLRGFIKARLNSEMIGEK